MRFIPPLIERDVFSDTVEGEEKARLIAALGHDLKGPLHVLGLSMQNLLSRAADSETKAILLTAEAAFDEVASLCEDLLDTLRFGIGVVSSREDGLSLARLFEDVRRRFRRRAEVEHIDLRVASTRVHCVADKHLLQRIVGNLVENALKHSQASRVLVGARLLGSVRVQLRVVDDGCGIPESELPFIFDEWFRGHRATSDGTRGQGLGLWAVRRCVIADQLLSTPADNLWKFATSDGRSVSKATAFMVPFVRDKKSWPKAKDVMYDEEWPMRHSSLLFAGVALNRSDYIDLWKKLPPDSSVEEASSQLLYSAAGVVGELKVAKEEAFVRVGSCDFVDRSYLSDRRTIHEITRNITK